MTGCCWSYHCKHLQILLLGGVTIFPSAVVGLVSVVAPVSTPWCHAEIDYSAANEFIAAHYGLLEEEESYFGSDRVVEPIYNAREGLVVGATAEAERVPPSLTNCGFQLVELGEDNEPETIQWDDLNSIRENYLPAVREAILSSYGNRVSDVYFWCPTVRRLDSQPTPRGDADRDSNTTTAPPLGSYAATVHIDTDVNAYTSMADLIQVVAKNRFPGTRVPVTPIVQALEHDGRRFAIVNAWRNIGSTPVRRAPLALRPMHYTQPNEAFPHGTPDWTHSPWYTIAEMKPGSELLLFAQYDRDAAVPSDLWHCALSSVNDNDGALPPPPPRESFDVRCLVVFHEQVPEDRDRWSRRSPSKLNFQESQTFCSEQAERRRQKQVLRKDS